MAHSNLQLYYRTLFGMVSNHGYSHTELESMMVFEKDIFVSMVMEKVNK